MGSRAEAILLPKSTFFHFQSSMYRSQVYYCATYVGHRIETIIEFYFHMSCYTGFKNIQNYSPQRCLYKMLFFKMQLLCYFVNSHIGLLNFLFLQVLEHLCMCHQAQFYGLVSKFIHSERHSETFMMLQKVHFG